jgi:hypothetical protein
MTYLSMTGGDGRQLTITASEDLADATLRFRAVSDRFDPESVVISKETGAGIEVGSPTTIAVISIEPVDTADLGQETLVWQLEIVGDDGPRTVAGGRLAVLRDLVPSAGS